MAVLGCKSLVLVIIIITVVPFDPPMQNTINICSVERGVECHCTMM